MPGKRLILAGVMAVVSLISCTSEPDDELDGIQARLNLNRYKWLSGGIQDYQYTFQWSCYCFDDYVKPVIIFVRSGVVISVRYVDSGAPVDSSNFDRYRTVVSLFDLLQEAIDNRAYYLSISYDPELGFPTSAYIDYEASVADEELGFRIESLTPLK